MRTGWVKVHRKILESALWEIEPFTRGQAWIDLILLANHSDGKLIVRDNIIDVKRGQVGWSQQRLAKRWKWSRTKVKNFLDFLEKSEHQIRQQKSSISSVITILNYDEYQKKDSRQDIRKTSGKPQEDTNKNEKNGKKISKDTEQAPVAYGNSDINSFIKGMNKYLDIKLPEDGQARRYARNALQLLEKYDSQGEIKKGREFLSDDRWENVKRFLADYTDEKISKGFSAQSWRKLYENIKLWVVNEGRLSNLIERKQ